MEKLIGEYGELDFVFTVDIILKGATVNDQAITTTVRLQHKKASHVIVLLNRLYTYP